jgi:hypothetical protein
MNGAILRVEFAPALMDRQTAAYYLSMSLRELDSLREKNHITPVGEGRRVKYRKSELDAYVERIVERPTSRAS